MKMQKLFYLNLIICFSLTMFFVGCVTTPPLQTPSGRPEVTLYGITKKQFFDEVAANAAIDGRVIREVNDYNIVIAKKNTSFGAAVLFGSSYDSTPEERITLTVIEVPRGIRIFATCTIVTNPGSAFEKTTTSSNLRGIQAELEKMKANYGGVQKESSKGKSSNSNQSPDSSTVGICNIGDCMYGKYRDGKCYNHWSKINVR